jgi:hypothetical protein
MGGLHFQAHLGIKRELISKIIRAKHADRVAQVVESLPSKHEALSSNSSIAKEEEEEKKTRQYLTELTKYL